ncbi:MAG TPA: TetR/AcrR family transcriptional regulator [Actinomycetes bacterium]|jgi:AcrR family transcriptional regulator
MIGDKTEATSGRIRSVAAELFAEKGYGETSLREIAERLGITKAALYYHYPSKEQLLQAIVQPFFDDIRVLVAHAEQELPSGPALRSFFEAYLDMLLGHRTVCALFLRDASSIVAIVPLYKEAIHLTRRLNSSIAGPDATDEQRLRTAAAFEVLGVALLTSSWLPDIPDDTVRKTLLDAAIRVLDNDDVATQASTNPSGASETDAPAP